MSTTAKAAPVRRRFRLTSARGCRRELVSVYAAARSGELDWGSATKAAYILLTLIRVIEGVDFEDRIKLIEQAISANRALGWRLDGHQKLVEDMRA
jgi:hypothetical protein